MSWAANYLSTTCFGPLRTSTRICTATWTWCRATVRCARYLYDILDEFIARGGKRARPAMAMLACEAVGGDRAEGLSSGCAIEFFHAAALIHDDIMDASLLRRGQKCAHIVHGEPLAINAGDYALGLVCTIVVRDPLLDDATKLAVLDVIGEMSERTVEGQALDVGWVRDDIYDLTPDDYLDMALGKTGYYSGIAPLKVGAHHRRGDRRADRGAGGLWQECPPSLSRSRTIS